MRTIIAYPEAEPEIRSPELLEYDISLITPLFGGGVIAGEVDPTMPIRASSVRGHLRFWWRATRGAKYATVQELKEKEGEIWGTTEKPSKVNIEIKNGLCSQKACAQYIQKPEGGYRLEWNPPFNSQNNPLPYVIFPFQGKAGRDEIVEEPAAIITSLKFTIRIIFKDKTQLDEIKSAIWAWVNFGGIGARTRRGCGSLYCHDFAPPDVATIGTWYEETLRLYGIPGGEQRPWPTIPKTILIKSGEEHEVINAWSQGIGVFKSYRQAPNIGRNPGVRNNRPGRSRWPEPEAIRNLICEQRSIQRPVHWHKVEKHINRRAFPRAAFGMPIIFEIRDECLNPLERRGKITCRRNIKPTITPDRDHDRMASPLIIKAIKTKKNSEYTSLILRLCTPELQAAYLRKGPEDLIRDYSVSAAEISNKDTVNYSSHPIFNRSNTGSALEGFITYAKENPQSFVEVGQEKQI